MTHSPHNNYKGIDYHEVAKTLYWCIHDYFISVPRVHDYHDLLNSQDDNNCEQKGKCWLLFSLRLHFDHNKRTKKLHPNENNNDDNNNNNNHINDDDNHHLKQVM